MTLQSKTFIVIALTFAALISVLYAVSQFIVLNSFSEQEHQDTLQNIERVRSALTDNLKSLEGTTRDWSLWDDTKAYVTGRNDAYYEANLAYDSPMITNRLNVMLFVDTQGRVVFSKTYDLRENKRLPFPQGLQKHIYPGSPLLHHTSAQSSITGTLALDDTSLLIASEPVLQSDGGGTIAGTLIFGRFLDTGQIKDLAKTTSLEITVWPVESASQPPDIKQVLPALLADTGQVAPRQVRVLDANIVAGYILMKDVFDRPAFVLKAAIPRDVYQRGLDTVNYYMLAILALGIIFGIVVMLLLQRLVLSRVARLNRDTAGIAASSDMSGSVAVAGSDELSHLALSINEMLRALQRQHEELKEGEEKYRAVVEQTGEAIFLVDIETRRVIQSNAASQILLGYSYDELGEISIDDIVAHDSDSDSAKQRVQQTTGTLRLHTTGNLRLAVERRYRRKNGTIVPVEVSDSHILYGGRDVLCVVARDITDRKRAEIILRDLAMRDGLTGLYNRREMQRMLKEAVEAYCYHDTPASLILLDLDYFKSINDTYGHQVGDDVLRWISHLLCGLVRPEDNVARYGGEELAVILPNTDTETAFQIAEQLRSVVASQPFEFVQNIDDSEKTVLVPVTISLGVACLSRHVTAVQPWIEAADQAMYEAKRGGRNRTVAYQTLSTRLQVLDP